MNRSTLALVAVVAAAAGCSAARPAGQAAAGAEEVAVVGDVEQRRARFVPVRLGASTAHLSAGDREALTHLVAAARVMDQVFLRQVWLGNPAFAAEVAALDGPEAAPARDYYRIMFGPWDRLEDLEPFLGTTPHPPGAGYYPEDMSREELDAHLASHPEDRKAFTSTTTVIRRRDGRLVAVPYSEEYGELLEHAAAELRAAADATGNESLRRFLRSRADAFGSDDYYESDLAWMDLDSDLEVVIGPYETYEDGLLGYKAAFEAFVCVVQPEDSRRLAVYKAELPWLERNLPIPDEHKNLTRGAESPISVADELFTAGDAKAGVQTLAFNLPNDERVREAKGSKKVLLKNIMRAKYDAILLPIAGRVLAHSDAGHVDFDSYFHFILFHELSHGLGPGRIRLDGRETEARLELKELYPAIEEAKADALGALALYQLAGRGVVPAAIVERLPETFTAGLFRSARFGTTEAHGLGVVIQANSLLAQGALEVTADGRFHPVAARFPAALEGLVRELLMIEATGSYAGARELAVRSGVPPAAMAALLASLGDIPVDIDPVFDVSGTVER